MEISPMLPKTMNGNKYTLDFESAYPYFIDHIECGKTLSQLVVESICFQKGKFYTFLPNNAIIERLNKPCFGVITPTNLYDADGHLIGPNPPGSHPDSTTKTITLLSSFVNTYLTQNPSIISIQV